MGHLMTERFSPGPEGRPLFATRLGRDFLHLDRLKDRKRGMRRTFFRIAKCPSIFLHTGLHRAQEFAFPIRKPGAGLLGGAARTPERAKGGAFGAGAIILWPGFEPHCDSNVSIGAR